MTARLVRPDIKTESYIYSCGVLKQLDISSLKVYNFLSWKDIGYSTDNDAPNYRDPSRGSEEAITSSSPLFLAMYICPGDWSGSSAALLSFGQSSTQASCIVPCPKQ